MTSARASAALALLFLAQAGCEFQAINSFSNDDVVYGTDDAALTSGNPRFAAAREVFKARCVTCHRAFSSYSEDQWIANGYVVAGNAGASSVYSRLRGSGVGGDENMPPSGAISSGELTDVRDWINQIGGGGSSGGSTGGTTGGGANAAQRLAAALDVVSRRCASCHSVTRTATSTAYSGATVPAFANFTTDNDFVVQGLADPGSPSTSWIYRALTGYGNIATMPQSGGAVSAADAAALNAWITQIGQP